MFSLWVRQRPHLCTSRRESNILQRIWSGDIYYTNRTDCFRGVAILFTPRFHYMLLNSLEPNLSPTYYNILGGDFNCILHPGATNLHTREFTWTRRDTRTMNSFICTCIDRFYTSQTSPYTLDSTILTYPHSDHDLISLSLDLNHQLPYVN